MNNYTLSSYLLIIQIIFAVMGLILNLLLQVHFSLILKMEGMLIYKRLLRL